MEIEEVLKNMKAYVWKEKFAILKVEKLPRIKDFFCMIKDKKENTLILKETDTNKVNATEIEKGYRIITFNMTLPFNVVGFILTISSVLAKAGIPILAISSYSTDHILVRERDLNKTTEILKDLGIKIE